MAAGDCSSAKGIRVGIIIKVTEKEKQRKGVPRSTGSQEEEQRSGQPQQECCRVPILWQIWPQQGCYMMRRGVKNKTDRDKNNGGRCKALVAFAEGGRPPTEIEQTLLQKVFIDSYATVHIMKEFFVITEKTATSDADTRTAGDVYIRVATEGDSVILLFSWENLTTLNRVSRCPDVEQSLISV